MPATTPKDLPKLFLAAFSGGAPSAVAALYEPDGVVAQDLEAPVRGREAIRQMVAGFMSQNPQFALHDVEVVEAAGLASVRARWTITTPNFGAERTTRKMWTHLIARRQPDGTWLVVVDRPEPPA